LTPPAPGRCANGDQVASRVTQDWWVKKHALLSFLAITKKPEPRFSSANVHYCYRGRIQQSAPRTKLQPCI